MLRKILWLIFLSVMLVFALVQFAMGNSGVIGLILCLIILLPLIAVYGFGLLQDIAAKKNWERYQQNKDKDDSF